MRPVTLNSNLHYQAVADCKNIAVYSTHPPSAQCPFCSRGVIRIYPEPRCGGYWWACNTCDHASTTFKLYQRLVSIDSNRIAWSLINKEIKLPPGAGSSAVFETTRKQDHIDEAMRQFWANAKNRMLKELPSKTVMIMQGFGLWDSFNYISWAKGMGQFIGVANRALWQGLPLDRKGLRSSLEDCVVLGYECVPGKPSGFLFTNGVTTKYKQESSDDAGILGLGVVKSYNDTIYALNSHTAFLSLQRLHIKDTATVGPIVSCVATESEIFNCTLTSRASWDCVHQPRVIFWDVEPGPELINQARHLGDRGWIATRPDPVVPDVNELKKFTVHQLMRTWDKSAKHWLRFLKELVCSLAPSNAQRVLQKLNTPLTTEETRQIRQMCTAKEWEFFSHIQGPSTGIRSFIYGRHTIVERPGLGWYKIDPSPKAGESIETRITDCYMQINQASAIGDYLLLDGTVFYGKQAIPFIERDAVVRENPASFLRRVCAEHQLGIPVIDRQFADQMLEMALVLNPPTTVTAVQRVGWHNGAFTLPALTIHNGTPQPRVAANVDLRRLPLANLTDEPIGRGRSSWDVDSPMTNLGLSILGAVMDNMLRRRRGLDPRGILVIDQLGGDAVLNKMCELLGLLRTRKEADVSDQELDQLRLNSLEHDPPLRLFVDQMSTGAWDHYWRNGAPHNIIMTTDLDTALNIHLNNQWQLLFANANEVRLDDLNGIETLAVAYLTHLSTGALIPFRDWLPLEMRHRLRILDTSETPMWEKLLRVIFTNIHSGQLRFGTVGAVSSRDNGIVRDPFDRAVYLRWRLLERQLQGWLLPGPNALDVSFSQAQGVENTPDGWRLGVELFEAKYAEFNQIFQP